MPIPKDRGIKVPLDADLIFPEAYKCTKNRVFFGPSPDDKTSIIAMPRVIISILSTPCFWHYNDVIKVA